MPEKHVVLVQFKKRIINTLLIKTAKILSLGIATLPLLGCAVGAGILFNGFILGLAHTPDCEELLFNNTMLCFAFIESFAFLLFMCFFLIYLL
jgi:F0F1-type ATP synthase membrane subunit c/vacuolar-type H+-ATPase subunit K